MKAQETNQVHCLLKQQHQYFFWSNTAEPRVRNHCEQCNIFNILDNISNYAQKSQENVNYSQGKRQSPDATPR